MSRPAWPAITGAALWVLALAGCGGDPDPGAGPSSASETSTAVAPATAPGTIAPATSNPNASDLYDAACAGTLEVATAGKVDVGAGAEISGIVASSTNPDVYWVHNDSGAGPEVNAITAEGTLLASYELDAEAQDWEDIAIGHSPTGAGWSLYLADIGDNNEVRPDVQLHRVAEPLVPADGSSPAAPSELQPLDAVDTITLTYPDRPHNAEALFVDPQTDEVVIITKEVLGPAQIFVAPASSLTDGATVTLTASGSVDFGDGGLAAWVTGADISSDGTVIAVRTYGGAHLFARAQGQSMGEALAGPSCDGPLLVEVQGEAIGFATDGRSYLTLSEGEGPIVHVTS